MCCGSRGFGLLNSGCGRGFGGSDEISGGGGDEGGLRWGGG